MATEVSITEIEDAIIEILQSATGMAYLKTVASYGGELDDDLAQVVRSFPSVWVTFAGLEKPIKRSATKWQYPAKFVTMVGARNVKNEASTRRGSALEVGAYQMLKDVQTLLAGNDFGLDIGRFEPGPVRTLYNTRLNGQGLSVLAIEWSTSFVMTKASAEAVDLLRIGANYYLKPGDDEVDAQDLISLRSET